jgi:hypothetical protein
MTAAVYILCALWSISGLLLVAWTWPIRWDAPGQYLPLLLPSASLYVPLDPELARQFQREYARPHYIIEAPR